MSEHAPGIIEVIVNLEGVGVIGKAGGVFDVEDVVPEPLQADDVMEMLPDDASDGTAAHEAHYYQALFLHPPSPRLRRTSYANGWQAMRRVIHPASS
jgi:hypothetical protein